MALTWLAFVSHANEDYRDGDKLLERFIQKLKNALRRRDLPPGLEDVEPEQLFVDRKALLEGESWKPQLKAELERSRVFVPVYSKSFFESDACGREWAIFADRLERLGKNKTLICPVLLRDPKHIRVPSLVKDVNYYRDGAYESHGLSGLKDDTLLDEFVEIFATRLVQRAEKSADLLALEPNKMKYDDFQSAFYGLNIAVSFFPERDSHKWVTVLLKKLQGLLDSHPKRPRLVPYNADENLDFELALVLACNDYIAPGYGRLPELTALESRAPVICARIQQISNDAESVPTSLSTSVNFLNNNGSPLKTTSIDFQRRVEELRQLILETLRAPRDVVGSEAERPVVYLGPVRNSREMYTIRDEVRSVLRDYGIETKTPSDYFFLEPEFKDGIEKSLLQCSAFVQLLDTEPIPSPPLPDFVSGLDHWFSEVATNCAPDLPILRWRRGEPSTDEDGFHRFAIQPSVRAFPLPEFCIFVMQEVLRQTQRRQAEEKKKDAWVFLFGDQINRSDILATVTQRLGQCRVQNLITVDKRDATLEEIAIHSGTGGIIVIQTDSQPKSVLSSLRELRDFSGTEASNGWTLGIWFTEEPAINVLALGEIIMIKDSDQTTLESFITAIQ